MAKRTGKRAVYKCIRKKMKGRHVRGGKRARGKALGRASKSCWAKFGGR